MYYMIPQVGSPWAMKLAVGNLAIAPDLGRFMQISADIANSISGAAGLEASFERRGDEWQQQLKLATRICKCKKQLAVANIKIEIAKRDLTIHNKNIQHNQEVYDYYVNRFSNLGLYNFYLVTQGYLSPCLSNCF
jgi:hypothetical protein